jgi:TRAP-type C4-dicarboxylate transport system permease small subunit
MNNGAAPAHAEARPPLVERLSAVIAVLGGLLAVCIAILVVSSVIGRWLYNSPINGDFELVQMGTAVAVFCYLPLCQARRGNIVVDTFTGWLPHRVVDAIDAFWDLVYAGVMGLISVCLITGTLEHYRSGQTTMLLQLIIWPALGICAALCGVLALVALTTAGNLIRGRT